ncbi:MAG: hypothetical protein ACK4Q5_14185 [Saprospiraceae bacterium]
MRLRLPDWFAGNDPCRKYASPESLFLGLKSQQNDAILCAQLKILPTAKNFVRQLRLPDDRVDEILNQSTLVFLQKIESGAYQFQGFEPTTYLVEVARRVALNATRTQKRPADPLENHTQLADPDTENLTDDADDAERRAADLVREGLAGLRLEATIAEVAATRRAWLRRRFWQRAIALGIGLLVLGALAFWVSRRADSHTPSIPPEKTPVSPQHIENQVPTTPPQQQAPAPQQPIAAGEKPFAATNGRAPAPTIRGENEVDEKRKARLAQVWAVE